MRVSIVLWCATGTTSFQPPQRSLSGKAWTRPANRALVQVSQSRGPWEDFGNRAASIVAGIVLSTTPMGMVEPASAADGAAIGTCLLKSCQLELAKCVTNPSCLANLVCIQTCNGKPDEAACQIRCGDIFDNEVIGQFNDCAVSQKKCVPQRENDNSWPLLPEGSIVTKFDTSMFTGRWYISAGLNEIFDTFPCQVHFFEAPGPGLLYGKLNWRVLEPDGEFLEKQAVQRFVQDKDQPGILYNHDNDYLHYQDDWYIMDFSEKKGEEFVLVYYRGRNDAWDGYGGAVLYTRAPGTPEAVKARAKAACDKAGVDFGKFVFTDNSCKASADAAEKLRLREQYASRELLLGEKAVQERLTAERQLISSAVVSEEKELSKDASMALNRLEKQIEEYEKELESTEKTIVKKAAVLEKKIENAVEAEIEEIEADLGFGKKTGRK